MRWQTSLKNAAIAGLFALSACAHGTSETETRMPSAGDVVDISLGVNGQPLSELLADPEKISQVMTDLFGKTFDGERGREELRAMLASLERGETPADGAAAFRGICGFSTTELVEAVAYPNQTRTVKGLIGDFLFEHDGNFSHDTIKYDGTWPGHLTVDVRILVEETVDGKVKPRGYERYQWHIDVIKVDSARDGFEVRRRQGDSNHPGDPFPDTVPFPDAALDPSNPNSLWARDLKYKLWAKGEEIVVRDVYHQPVGGQIARLPDTHEFYKPCAESCIDMMTRDFPPSFRIDFPEQSGYCLGRCVHPFIVNSM